MNFKNRLRNLEGKIKESPAEEALSIFLRYCIENTGNTCKDGCLNFDIKSNVCSKKEILMRIPFARKQFEE